MKNKLRACVHTTDLGIHISEVRIVVNLLIVFYSDLLIVNSFIISEVMFYIHFHIRSLASFVFVFVFSFLIFKFFGKLFLMTYLPQLRLLLGPWVR